MGVFQLFHFPKQLKHYFSGKYARNILSSV